MSDYTYAALVVFKARYEASSSWIGSAKTEDTYSSGIIMEARLGSLLYPSSLRTSGVNFSRDANYGLPLKNGVRVGNMIPLIGFRPPMEAFGARALDAKKSGYLDANSWYRKDWTLTDLVNAGLSSSYAEYLQKARNIFDRAYKTLDWIPTEIRQKVDAALSCGFMPTLYATNHWVQNYQNALPEWCQSEGRQAAWNDLRELFKTLNNEITTANLNSLKAEATKIESDIAFWQGVAKWTGIDYMMTKWAELKQKVQDFNASKRLAEDSLRRSDALVLANPKAFDNAALARLEAVKEAIRKNTAGADLAITPVKPALSNDALTIQGLGGYYLGIAPIIIAAIGVAIVVGATAALITYVVAMEETRRQAMAVESDFIKQRDTFDQQQYQAEMTYIRNRETELNAMLDQKKITQASYEDQMQALSVRAKAAGIDLTRKREQTIDAGNSLAVDLRKAPVSTVEGSLAQTKWIILGVGLLGALWYFGPALGKMLGKKAGSSTPSTPPTPAT